MTITKGISIIVITGLSLAMTTGCQKEKEAEKAEIRKEETATTVTLTPAACRAIGLRAEAISPKNFSPEITVPAKVLANQDNEALVGSLVQGRVCRVFAKTGSYVKAGQELMRLEGLEIGEIKAKYLTAKASLSYQKKNLERQQKLLEENVGSRKAFLESQNEYEKAVAEFGAEKNRISAIGLNDSEVAVEKEGYSDEHCHGVASLAVRTPITGLVVERNVVMGQLIDASTNAFRIINLGSVWVDGQVYEKDIEKVAGNSTVFFIATAFPGESFSGKISYIGQVIDEKTRTITVRAEFTNGNGKLKPQMFGELKIPAAKKNTALLVPAEAMVKMDSGDILFVKKEEFVFEKRTVLLGGSLHDLVEIREGLKDGEKVVVKGAFYLKAELLKSSQAEGE